MWGAAAFSSIAATNDALRPPRETFPVDVLERYRWVSVAALLLMIGVAVALARWRSRPGKYTVRPPAVVARTALEGLRGRAEDEPVAAVVASVLRTYLRERLVLGPEEWTTAELRKILAEHPRGVSVADRVCGLLGECDARKFAPQAQWPESGLVAHAWEIVEAVEKEFEPAPVAANTSGTP
ncbi:MAG TPA: hypothetical protein VNZ22_00180 [Bacillota bacterium]|nr:hypothetical protein [Bacillota bacterium]